MLSFILIFLVTGTSIAEERGPIKKLSMLDQSMAAIRNSTSVTSADLHDIQIGKLPMGSEAPIAKLITGTTMGTVLGAFGQIFFRGNHSNIQYQIDGIEFPESPSNTFSEPFHVRNIEHIEVITGGIGAEYGTKLAAVVNIDTKSGELDPNGDAIPHGEIQLNYGSYGSTSPHLLLGGSNSSETFKYFLSGSLYQSDHGLETPDPISTTNQNQGGTGATHDLATGHSELVKMDWYPSENNKLTLLSLYNYSTFQTPNYPSTFNPSDPYFQPGFTDQYGNGGNPAATTYNYVPANTDDNQIETSFYTQLVWRHNYSEKSQLQIAPYYKNSGIIVNNDPVHDLFTSATGAGPITGSNPSSFSENRRINHFGYKMDYSFELSEAHKIKMGVLLQTARSEGPITIQTDLAGEIDTDADPSQGFFEGVYIQDDFSFSDRLGFNLGLRWDGTQFKFTNDESTDASLQPRVGMSLLIGKSTKIHAFYGRLFQPAPIENLRATFNKTTGRLDPYDVKAEKDDYFEFGIVKFIGRKQVVSINTYYKNATNMLDDAQLLNTSLLQPYNFALGYSTGFEIGWKAKLIENFTQVINYSYNYAQGEGISGGIFAAPSSITSNYQFLNHVQFHTANMGLTYSTDYTWIGSQLGYGSGLRTGPSNSGTLPAHFTWDMTAGHKFRGNSWFTKFKLSLDALNILNNAYPITLANGYNGSHYATGSTYWVRLTKEI